MNTSTMGRRGFLAASMMAGVACRLRDKRVGEGLGSGGGPSSRANEGSAVDSSGLPFEMETSRLSNGLTVLCAEGSQPGKFVAYVVVRVGSSQEPDSAHGLAHYLEHMMFKGTSRIGTTDPVRERALLGEMSERYRELSEAENHDDVDVLLAEIDELNTKVGELAIPGEFLGLFEQMGSSFVSASTSDEATAYFCSLPVSRFRAWAQLEAERFRDPIFRLFHTELEVVQEERRKIADDGSQLRFDTLLGLMFTEHGYGTHPPIGLAADLEKPRFDLLSDFHRRWYTPKNAALILIGDFSGIDVNRVLEKEFAGWVGEEPLRAPSRTLDPLTERRHRTLPCPGSPSIAVGWPVMGRASPAERARLDLLARLLWDGESGRLASGSLGSLAARSPSVFAVHHSEASYLHVGLLLQSGEKHADVETAILEALASLRDAPPDLNELLRVRARAELELQWSLESDTLRAIMAAEAFASGEAWHAAIDRMALLRGAQPRDVAGHAAALAERPYCVVHTVSAGPPPLSPLPRITPIQAASGQQSDRAREILAIVDPTSPLRLPQAGVEYTLDEGPRGPVIWTRNPTSQLFFLRILVDGGFATAPGLALGLAHAEVPCEEEGRDGLGCAALGGVLSQECGPLSSYIQLTGLERNLEALIELTDRRLSARAFSPAESSALEQLLCARYVPQNPAAELLARRAEELVIHGARPPDRGSIGRYANASRWQTPRDPLAERGLGLLYFGSTPPSSLPRLSVESRGDSRWTVTSPRPHLPEQVDIVIVDQPFEGAELRVIFADKSQVDPPSADLHQAYLSNWSGVLNRELREKRALVYHIGVETPHREYDPSFYRLVVWANTSPARAAATLKQVLDLATATNFDLPSLEGSRAGLLERLQLERPGARDLAQSLFAQHVGRGAIETEASRARRRDRIRNITPAKLQAVAPAQGSATVIIVGDRSKLDLRALESIGSVRTLRRVDVVPA